MRKLTKLQREVLEEIAYGFHYRVARGSSGRRHGYIKRAPEGGAWEKASITVKALIAFPSPLLAELPTENSRVYLSSLGWTALTAEEYPPAGSEAAQLTILADERVQYLLSMLVREDGDDMGVAGEYSRRHVPVR